MSGASNDFYELKFCHRDLANIYNLGNFRRRQREIFVKLMAKLLEVGKWFSQLRKILGARKYFVQLGKFAACGGK